MSYSEFKGVAYGPSKAGLTTVGYQIFNPDGSAVAPRVTDGVLEYSPGTYGATITFQDNFTGELRWDTGGVSPIYVSDFINDGGAVTTVAEEANPMRVVNFRDDVLYGMAHILGVDPVPPSGDLLINHARAWCAFINRHVRNAFKFWQWPELNITEERAFRQVWTAGKTYVLHGAGGEGDEVYYIPDQQYYRVILDPPAGTVPINGLYWEAINPLDRFIAYEQPGKQAIGKITGIYSVDPRTAPGPSAWRYGPSERGIDLPSGAGPTVWISYQVREPKFSVTPHNPATTYARHQIVYDTPTGKCYLCIVPNTGAALTGPSWLEQQMPYVIAEYVKLAAAAEAADDQNMRVDLAMQARKALEDEADELIEQGSLYFYNPRGPARLGLGLKDFYWSVNAPTLTGPGYGS